MTPKNNVPGRRPIEFRGLRNGIWHYLTFEDGGLCWSNELIILLADKKEGTTTFEAFCEFTGLLDRKGTKIFEGDILQYEGTMSQHFRRVVEFDLGAFGYRDKVSEWVILARMALEFKVIGNIHENPELLKG